VTPTPVLRNSQFELHNTDAGDTSVEIKSFGRNTSCCNTKRPYDAATRLLH